MRKLYLLQQSQVIELFDKKSVSSVRIERVSVKKWYPVFSVSDKEIGEVDCAIRLEKGNDLRTWADLRLLTEFLIDKCNVTECLLRLQ